MYAIFSSLLCVLHAPPSDLPWFYHTLITFGESHKLWSFFFSLLPLPPFTLKMQAPRTPKL